MRSVPPLSFLAIPSSHPESSLAPREFSYAKLHQEGLQGFNEWLTEVCTTLTWCTCGITGCCTEGGEGLLVYESMPNAYLDTHLFFGAHPSPVTRYP